MEFSGVDANTFIIIVFIIVFVLGVNGSLFFIFHLTFCLYSLDITVCLCLSLCKVSKQRLTLMEIS